MYKTYPKNSNIKPITKSALPKLKALIEALVQTNGPV